MPKRAKETTRRALTAGRGGNVAILAAAGLPLLVGSLALGVDWGYLAYQKRKAQADTDLAAVSAAYNPDDPAAGLTTYLDNNGVDAVIVAPHAYAAEIERQGSKPATARQPVATYQSGNYAAVSSRAPADRFRPGERPFNAVEVRMWQPGQMQFASLFAGPPDIHVDAVAGTDAIAAFSIGSRLASLDDGVLNGILGSLLGTELSLSVMDYEALLDADVDVLSFLSGIATELDLTAATYEDVLDARVSTGSFFEVLAGSDGVTVAARNVLLTISRLIGRNGLEFELSDLVGDIGSLANLGLGQDPGLAVDAGVLDMVTAAAAVAGGDNQVALDLGATIPGLASLQAELAIGEPAKEAGWFAVGPTGTMVRTAQTRLRITARIGGEGLLAGLAVSLPIFLDLAYAEGELADIACHPGSPNSVDVEVAARPGLVEAWIGDAGSDALADGPGDVDPAVLVKAPLLRIEGYAHADMGNTRTQTLRFNARDIEEGRVRSVSTSELTTPLVTTLVGDLQLDVSALGLLRLTSPTLLQRALVATLTPLTRPLDTVVYNLLLALGVKVGEADIRVTGAKCGRPVLVQ